MQRGPLAMMGASLAFTIMIALVKVAREDLPALEIVFWRALIALPLLLPALRGARLRITQRRAFAMRVIFGVSAMLCFFTAARGLPLVDLNLITRLQPVLVALLAPMVLGASERAGRGIWLASLTGIIGCGLVLTPTVAVGSWFGIVALGATFLSAGAHLALRRVAARDGKRAIVLWFHVAMTAIAGSLLLGSGHGIPLPEPRLWPVLIGIGCSAMIGQLLLTRAYSSDRAPVVAAASYTGVIWALLLDLLVFGLIPSALALTGGALLIASGIVLLRQSSDTRTGPGWN